MYNFFNITSLRRTIINSAELYNILLTLCINGCFSVLNNKSEQNDITFKFYFGVEK